ncbi:uncharacterized protein LOC142071164 [Caretta caretta]|uniref:uncharacterized protein LOC142071164 n=1 Tax=Caretta caretta TaxID=8467 RepID=UPI003F4C479E
MASGGTVLLQVLCFISWTGTTAYFSNLGHYAANRKSASSRTGGAFADGRGGFVLEEGGAAAPLPAVLLRVVLMGLERGVLVSGSPAAAAAAGARLSLPAGERLRRRELLGVLKRPRLGLWRGRRRGLGGGSRVLLAEAAVLGAELVQAPLQLVDALALGVDEALLVLHDGGELLQMPYQGKHGAHSAQLTVTAAVVSWVLLSADDSVGLLTIVIHHVCCNSALLLPSDKLGGAVLVLLGAVRLLTIIIHSTAALLSCRYHTTASMEPAQLTITAAVVSIVNTSCIILEYMQNWAKRRQHKEDFDEDMDTDVPESTGCGNWDIKAAVELVDTVER